MSTPTMLHSEYYDIFTFRQYDHHVKIAKKHTHKNY